MKLGKAIPSTVIQSTAQTDQSGKREMRYAFCPISQKAAALRQFTFTMSYHIYRPLSRHDTQPNNHYTLYMNSLKDH